MKEIPLLDRAAGYAEALIEQAEADGVSNELLGYAAAIMLRGLAGSQEHAVDVLNEVEENG